MGLASKNNMLAYDMRASYLFADSTRGTAMTGRFIKGAGAYLPVLRLDRASAATALAWSGLPGARTGHRAVASWDEDALTMAVEAARAMRASAPGIELDSVIFASTSAPFFERSQATLVAEALHLSSTVATLDVAGSRRCGVAALMRALLSGGSGNELIAAGEKRKTQAGSALQLAWGDGAAAILVSDEGIAKLIGHASISADMVDVYASPEHPAPYQSEERFIRDEAVGSLLAPAIRQACHCAGIQPGDIDMAVVPEPVPGTYKQLSTKLGLKAANLCEAIQTSAGDLGAAQPLFGLALALEQAEQGAKILVAGFGSGCDALVLEVTGKMSGNSATGALAEGAATTNYVRFLNLAGSLDLDWGPRSELDQKISASVLARYGRDMHGFVGGRDARGNVQFPKTLVPVSPDAVGPEALEDIVLTDVPAKIVSITADRLNFTPDPPFHFGLVQFANGARISMEFCDVERAAPKVGDAVRMRFRVKAIDRKRGFRTYFWKAAPVSRPLLEKA